MMAGTCERRSRLRVTLLGASAASEVSTRNFSDQATSGRQNSTLTPMTITIMTPMAMTTWARFPSATDAATYDPMPGSA